MRTVWDFTFVSFLLKNRDSKLMIRKTSRIPGQRHCTKCLANALENCQGLHQQGESEKLSHPGEAWRYLVTCEVIGRIWEQKGGIRSTIRKSERGVGCRQGNTPYCNRGSATGGEWDGHGKCIVPTIFYKLLKMKFAWQVDNNAHIKLL